MSFTDRIRQLSQGLLSRLGLALHHAGIHANGITIAGFVLVGLAALIIASGQMQLAALLLVLALPLDALDGAVARAAQNTNPFGGILDSTLDRYADGFLFGALGYHFAQQGQAGLLLLALAALLGSFAVSYVRARAGEAGISLKAGLFTRLERVLLLLLMLLIPPLLIPGLWLLAVGTNLTALQRLWLVYRTTTSR
jgi:phosphatidylglycerophosphate synthase